MLLALLHLMFCNSSCSQIVGALGLDAGELAARFPATTPADSSAVTTKIAGLCKDLSCLLSYEQAQQDAEDGEEEEELEYVD